MEYGLRDRSSKRFCVWLRKVLILVLMEYGLRDQKRYHRDETEWSLNPCFNGIWSASPFPLLEDCILWDSLNPCFNGIWSASPSFYPIWISFRVLILVLMEYGLRVLEEVQKSELLSVLILVLMEYGLRGSNLWRSVCEPFTTKKTAEPENFEGKHVPLSANIQRFFELIVQRVISTLQFWGFGPFSPSRMTLLIGFCVAQVRHPQRYATACRSCRGEAP